MNFALSEYEGKGSLLGTRACLSQFGIILMKTCLKKRQTLVSQDSQPLVIKFIFDLSPAANSADVLMLKIPVRDK